MSALPAPVVTLNPRMVTHSTLTPRPALVLTRTAKLDVFWGWAVRGGFRWCVWGRGHIAFFGPFSKPLQRFH